MFSSSLGKSTDHNTDIDADGEYCHKTARHKLTENVRMAAEVYIPTQSTVLLIDIEMSDDSRDKDESPPDGILRSTTHTFLKKARKRWL